MLEYIVHLSKDKQRRFELITFEQPEYQLSDYEVGKTQLALAEKSIYWYPLRFHTGKNLLLQKSIDLLSVIRLTIQLKARHQPKALFCFANVSASIGVLLNYYLNAQMIIFSYEPHAKFMVDTRQWSKNSLKFRVLNRLELMAAKRAQHIMTGTQHMVDQLQKIGIKAYRVPTAVDSTKYQFDEKQRLRIRQNLNIVDRTVLIYVGKFGGLYYDHEIAEACHYLCGHLRNPFLIVVTPDPYERAFNTLATYLDPTDFHLIHKLDRRKVPDYLSAADLGISGIPPLPHQKFRSPTKIAEYLLCGLPYLTCAGVSEDDKIANQNNVGIVVDDMNDISLQKEVRNIQDILSLPKTEIAVRCRNAGMEYRSMERVLNTLDLIYAQIK